MSLAAPDTLYSAASVRPGRLATIAGFVAALNAADIGAATSCFLARGVFVTPDATHVQGHEGIRDLLAQLVASGTGVGVEADRTSSSRGIVTQRWRLRRDGIAGQCFEQLLHPLFGMRHVGTGWKVEFLAPWWDGRTGYVGIPSTESTGQRRSR